MKSGVIPDDIRRFILGNIPSVSCMEAMLLMRSVKEHHWSVEELSRRLFINEPATTTTLKQLQEAGIIKIVDQKTLLYQYYPQHDELRNLIDQVATIYCSNLIEVTNLIHSNIDQKAHKFADAFIWRKD